MKTIDLKDSFTLEEAAVYLSQLTEESIARSDLKAFGLLGLVTLSIKLTRRYPAMTGKMVDVNDAALIKIPLKAPSPDRHSAAVSKPERCVFIASESGRFIERSLSHAPHSETPDSFIIETLKLISESPEADSAVFFRGDLSPDGRGVIELNEDRIDYVTDLWDLPLVGTERLSIKGAPVSEDEVKEVDMTTLRGVLLKHPYANRWARLHEKYSDGRHYNDPRVHGEMRRLPEGEEIVIRTDELKRFADVLLPKEELLPLDPDCEIRSEDLQHLIAAADKFWVNADPDDRGTWPPKDMVVTHLINLGFSRRAAATGATIATPSWGRRNQK
ncbi:hypothetical protein [Marinobacter sp. F4216]|uniref:hypothetical protein n=1 Tax=Marinobacter sp. F4216 TaxID=2874281 RepID=UPI001CBC85A2|nr:hypothetical protein [Marinobacter sp. F4216]MBZ2169038.1 hypothetical protein [Marinobacter sp. F4216]